MTSQSPTVSVVIPTYNRAEMLIRAIQSVLRQTYKDYEIIVVDDGSTDSTPSVIKEYEHNEIKYIRNNSNKGGAFARNLGLDHSNGKYIAFLDSDDEWLPTKLEKQIGYIENCPTTVGAVYCQVLDKSDVLRRNISRTKKGNVYSELLRGWCPPTTSSFLIRSEALKTGVRFDEALSSFQDYDLWIQLSKYWEFDFVPEPLVIFHHHEESRVSIDLLPRVNGLEYFLNKWSENIYNYGGKHAIDFLYKKYLSIVYSHAALDNLRKNERIIALQLFKKLLKTRRITVKFLIKFIILFIGNKTLIKVARSIRRNFEKFLCMNLTKNRN